MLKMAASLIATIFLAGPGTQSSKESIGPLGGGLRQEMRLLCALFCILIHLSATAAFSAEYKQERYIMGTMARITLFASFEAQADKAFDAAFAEMSKVDQLMSNWKEDSEIMKVNAKAASEAVEVSPELFEVLQACVKYYELSGGAFDVTVGPLVRLWGFLGGEKRVPDPREIKQLLSTTGSRKIILNSRLRTVRFRQPGVYIDLGGIAKGYAVDKAVSALKRQGITRALVDLGRNIYALETNPDGPSWEVGVQHPRKEDGMLTVLHLKNQAAATSGDYEKFFTANGKRYSHILDPRTGYPAEGTISATVVAPTAMESDALSTAVFVLGIEKGVELGRKIGGTAGIVTSAAMATANWNSCGSIL